MPTRQRSWSPHLPIRSTPRHMTGLPLACGGWAAVPPARDPEPVLASPSIPATTSPSRSRRDDGDGGAGDAPTVPLAPPFAAPASAFSVASDGKFRTDALLGQGGSSPPSTSNKHAMSKRSMSAGEPFPAGRLATDSSRQAELAPKSCPHKTRHTRCSTQRRSRTQAAAPDELHSAVHHADRVAMQPPSAASCLPHGGWPHPRRHRSPHTREHGSNHKARQANGASLN